MFPDNTALINFAIINRMDLLARLANGNGRWCATVATECAESAKRPELAALAGAADIFGEALAGPGDQPSKHLGEAGTLAIIVRRQLACFFVTDDRDATRLAAKNRVKAVNTWLLLSVAYRQGWLDADTLWGYVQTLGRQRRGAPPGVRDRLSFDKWLSG
jgi:predicted nucleic acid-binding protein